MPAPEAKTEYQRVDSCAFSERPKLPVTICPSACDTAGSAPKSPSQLAFIAW